jgi:hypothetical protein
MHLEGQSESYRRSLFATHCKLTVGCIREESRIGLLRLSESSLCHLALSVDENAVGRIT